MTLPDGTVFDTSYAHLQEDAPVAKNERKGREFNVRDKVFAGEVIGYSGRTGNAWDTVNVPIAHVHVGVKRNGQWVDPKDYINGTYAISNLSTTNGKIFDIDCK